jgi:hypothetical protein
MHVAYAGVADCAQLPLICEPQGDSRQVVIGIKSLQFGKLGSDLEIAGGCENGATKGLATSRHRKDVSSPY